MGLKWNPLVWIVVALIPEVASAQLVSGQGIPLVPDLLLPSMAPDQLEFDHFGWSVDLYGDTLVVGAPHHDGGMTLPIAGLPPDLGFDSGAVYVFVRGLGGAWTQQAKLTSPLLTTVPRAAEAENFGSSVALSGDTLAIGAEGNTFPVPPALLTDLYAGGGYGSVGGVYIFTRTGSTWAQQGALLRGAQVSNQDHFGGSVDLDGDTLVVGARFGGALPFTLRIGHTYVFERAAGVWTQTARLAASSFSDFDHFGNSVSISGATIVIGAPGTNGIPAGSIPDAGAAYVFDKVGALWIQTAVLMSAAATSQDYFGWAVSVDQDSIAVGAPFAETGLILNGNVTMFSRTGSSWTEDETLSVCDPIRNAEDVDQFGSAVSLRGDHLLVGAWSSSVQGLTSGAAHFYTRDPVGGSWEQNSVVQHPAPALLDRFGVAVALDGDPGATDIWLAGTAWKRDVSGAVNAGEAYVFPLTESLIGNLCNGDGGDQMGCTDCPSCNTNATVGTIGGCLNSAGNSGRLISSGTGSLLCHDLRFEATGLPASTIMVLQSSTLSSPKNMAHICYSLRSGTAHTMPGFDGLRCIAGPFKRYVTRSADLNGEIGQTNKAWGPPSNPMFLGERGGAVPGATLYYYGVYRDVDTTNCGTGLNTTQSVEVMFHL